MLSTCALTSQVDRIIFCVFLNIDYNIYSELLNRYFPPERPLAWEQEKEGEGEEGPPGEGDSKETEGGGVPSTAVTGAKEPAAAGEEKDQLPMKEELEKDVHVPILQKSITEPGKPTKRHVFQFSVAYSYAIYTQLLPSYYQYSSENTT